MRIICYKNYVKQISKNRFNIFIKVIYLYLKEMKGQLYYRNNLYNAELIYKAFRNNINSKFCRTLTKKDYEIIDVLEHFKILGKV